MRFLVGMQRYGDLILIFNCAFKAQDMIVLDTRTLRRDKISRFRLYKSSGLTIRHRQVISQAHRATDCQSNAQDCCDRPSSVHDLCRRSRCARCAEKRVKVTLRARAHQLIPSKALSTEYGLEVLRSWVESGRRRGGIQCSADRSDLLDFWNPCGALFHAPGSSSWQSPPWQIALSCAFENMISAAWYHRWCGSACRIAQIAAKYRLIYGRCHIILNASMHGGGHATSRGMSLLLFSYKRKHFKTCFFRCTPVAGANDIKILDFWIDCNCNSTRKFWSFPNKHRAKAVRQSLLPPGIVSKSRDRSVPSKSSLCKSVRKNAGTQHCKHYFCWIQSKIWLHWFCDQFWDNGPYCKVYIHTALSLISQGRI